LNSYSGKKLKISILFVKWRLIVDIYDLKELLNHVHLMVSKKYKPTKTIDNVKIDGVNS